MPQYHYLDDSGDFGLDIASGASSHLVLAMVQLPHNAAIPEMANLRHTLRLTQHFEFKYAKTTWAQKVAFFGAINAVQFRVRAVALHKSRLRELFPTLSGQPLQAALIAALVLRASPLDVADDVLNIDGGTQSLIRMLRIRLSQACRDSGRARPFRKLVGGNSQREDGLQLADMVAGAIRQHIVENDSISFNSIAAKVVAFWGNDDE